MPKLTKHTYFINKLSIEKKSSIILVYIYRPIKILILAKQLTILHFFSSQHLLKVE